MKTSILFLGLSFLYCLPGCVKNNDPVDESNPKNDTPKIISFLPTLVTTGSTVTILGENFGVDILKVVLKLDTISLPISTVTTNSIVFNIPTTLISGGARTFNMQVIVNGKVSNTIPISIKFEARGWNYINKNIGIINNRIPINMHFYNDEFGLIAGNFLLNSTSDSGLNWNTPSGTILGKGFNVYNDSEAWIENNGFDVLKFNYNNNTYNYARIDTITTIPKLGQEFISGLYITKPGHGYIVTHEGCIFKVNGSFSPSNIRLEYQSANYTALPISTIGYYDQISGIDSMNFMIYARPMVNNVKVPYIIHKRNGVYTEYNLSSLLGAGWVYRLQYVDANTAYFISINFDMYKFNFTNNTWARLATPTTFNSFIFLNSLVGYASSGFISGQTTRKIYKTIDGGLTWNADFTLDDRFYSYVMATKNNKLWVFGENGFGNFFLLKYNP